MSGTTPWKDGYWKAKSDDDYIQIVKGSEVSVKSITAILDYPDFAETEFEGKWTLGDFGEASEDLKKFEARYQAELSAGLVSASAQFDYAWCLVRSKYPSDIRKGILLLEDLYTVRFLFIL